MKKTIKYLLIAVGIVVLLAFSPIIVAFGIMLYATIVETQPAQHLILDIPQKKFGKFIKAQTPELQCSLNVGRYGETGYIFSCGANIYNIFDAQNNEVRKITLPKTVTAKRQGEIFKLGNDKILLTLVNDNTNPNIKYISSVPEKNETNRYEYDSMAIFNLKTGQVEKIIQKEVCKNWYASSNEFIELNNGKILIIGGKYGDQIEIFDPEKETTKMLNAKMTKHSYSALPKCKDKLLDKLLIFGISKTDKNTENSKDACTETVLEYDDKTETIKVVGESFARKNPFLKQINNKEILIMGGEAAAKCKNRCHQGHPSDTGEIEIYNTETNTSKIIGCLKYKRERMYDFRDRKSSFAAELINDRYILIAGGMCGGYYLNSATKTSEILDIKTGKIVRGPNMNYQAYNQITTKLKNGDILLFGGQSHIGDKRSAEIFKINKVLK